MFDCGISGVGESRNQKRTYFPVVGGEAGVPMRLWIEITSSENKCHFVAFGDDWFGCELRCILLTTDLPNHFVITLNLK